MKSEKNLCLIASIFQFLRRVRMFEGGAGVDLEA